MKTGDPIQLGDRVFEVVERLGAGRTAEVSLVRCDRTEWVVKVLRDPDRAGIDIDAFLAEAATLDRLLSVEQAVGGPTTGSHFPTVHVVDADRGLIAMDRAPGRSLVDVVGRTVLSVEQCLSVGRQLCEALGTAIEAGIYNPDVKLDSIFWDPRSDELTIIDWNVSRPWPPAERTGDWLDPYTAMVGEVLDLLLLDLYGEGEHDRPDWSRPPRYPPDRWSDYLRIFQLTFMQMQDGPAEWSIAALQGRLGQVEEALVGEPDDLIRRVIELLVDARDREAVRARRLDEALAFAELAANLRNPGVIFRARELIGQAVDQHGDEVETLTILRQAVRGEGREVHVRPGNTIEFHRLKRMAHAGHAVLGAADGLRKVLEAYEGLKWQTAAGQLSGLLQRFGSQDTLVEELTPLMREAEGLTACRVGLKHLHEASCFEVPDGTMHGFDPESVRAMEADRAQALGRAADALERALSSWAEVPWRSQLLVRFPEIEDVAVEVRAEAQAIGERLAARAAYARSLDPQPPAPSAPAASGEALGRADDRASRPRDASDPPVAASPGPDVHPEPRTAEEPDEEERTDGRGGWGTLLLFALAVGLAIVVWVIWPFGPQERGSTGAADVGPIADSAPEVIRLTVGAQGATGRVSVDASVTDAAPPDQMVDAGPPPDAIVDARKPPPRKPPRRRTRPTPKRKKDAQLEDLPPPVDAALPPVVDARPPALPPVDMNRPKPPPVDAGVPPPRKDASPSSPRDHDYNF